jgi:hypothetical protein
MGTSAERRFAAAEAMAAEALSVHLGTPGSPT